MTVMAAVSTPGTEYLRVSHGGDGGLNRAALESNMVLNLGEKYEKRISPFLHTTLFKLGVSEPWQL